MSDITTMFVWIPRYSYKIDNSVYHKVANRTATIEIKWLVGTTDVAMDGTQSVEYNSNTTNNYTKFPDDFVTHPAFKADTDFGGTGEEITGFWVGKFESSNYKMATEHEGNRGITNSSRTILLCGQGDNTNVTIKPNVTAWRFIDVTNISTKCENMNADGNIHGLTSDTKTTMMQNSQWGAVAYLAQSDYGNKQIASDTQSGIWNNSYTEGYTFTADNEYGMSNYSTNLTGMVGIRNGQSSGRDNSSGLYSKLVSKTENADGTISITFQNINSGGSEGSNYTNIYYKYNTENGQKGSTTRNIYGIYDMAGCSWEYMANSISKGIGSSQESQVNNLKTKDSRYVTIYKGEADSTEGRLPNYLKNKHMYGDAIWETSMANSANGGYSVTASWNGDYSFFPYAGNPVFARGGAYNDSSGAGMFYLYHSSGVTHNAGFRSVAF